MPDGVKEDEEDEEDDDEEEEDEEDLEGCHSNLVYSSSTSNSTIFMCLSKARRYPIQCPLSPLNRRTATRILRFCSKSRFNKAMGPSYSFLPRATTVLYSEENLFNTGGREGATSLCLSSAGTGTAFLTAGR